MYLGETEVKLQMTQANGKKHEDCIPQLSSLTEYGMRLMFSNVG